MNAGMEPPRIKRPKKKHPNKKQQRLIKVLVACAAVASFAIATLARAHFKGSFAGTLLDDTDGEFLRKNLGPECTDFLLNIYRAGKSLKSEKLLEASSTIGERCFQKHPL